MNLLAQDLVTTSTAEAVQFWILGSLALIGALGVVASTKAVYSALFLATTMIILAIFYIAQGALFLGVVQIVVYTGAVMMLFLFVLMLVGVDSSDSMTETLRGQRVGAMVVGLGFGFLLIGGLGNASRSGFTGFTGQVPPADGNVEALADLIFIRYVWAFELTGALLITATIGAMMLAHRESGAHTRDQKQMSQARFREGGRVTPLPSAGVYARHNAVDIPARLPDGTVSELSVSAVFQRRDPDASERADGERR